MRILITGSTGFIGSNLVKFYKGVHHITTFGRHDNIVAKLEESRPDLIINCAAEIYNQNSMFFTNVMLVRDILEWMIENKNCQLIQLGSSSEYGPVDRPTKETDPIQAYDMYSGTKGMATLLCQSYAAAHKVDVQIVRPYSPFGSGERPHRLFPNLWKSFKLDKPMTLKDGVHDFLYINDFVDAIDKIVNEPGRTPGEVINISSGQQYTNMQVFELFKYITGKPGNVSKLNEMSTWPCWQADISHARKKYNWMPKTTLVEGIELFLEHAQYE